MKAKLMNAYGRLLLRKYSIIETINDQLKNIFQIDQTSFKKEVSCEFIYGYSRINASTKKPKLKIKTALTRGPLMSI